MAGSKTPNTAAESPQQSSETARLRELRDLIVGPERTSLQQLIERLENTDLQREQLSQLLPGAIERRNERDDRLVRSLRSTVEEILQSSVRRKPQVLAQALFPLMGPAIRQAVRAGLSSMLQNLQQVLDRSLSWKGLQWRLEAFRSRRPFSEVALLHTLRFRVEQVLLIHRKSGLLIQHLVAPGMGAGEPELVSAMLTAIQDFGRDSFQADEEDALESLNLGELLIWLEQGPHAHLAAVIRGQPPMELRDQLQTTLENIHSEKAWELAEFEGDSAPFESVTELLEDCLQSELKESTQKAFGPRLIAAGAILIILLLGWTGLKIRDRSRWNSFTSTLKQQPGILLVEARRSGGEIWLSGLRDPLAEDPSDLLEKSGFGITHLHQNWQPFYSFEPRLANVRANRILAPPESVDLSLAEGVLRAKGRATRDWILSAQRLAPLLPGVTAVDFSSLTNLTAQRIQEIVDHISQVQLVYPRGSSRLPENQNQKLARFMDLMFELREQLLANGSVVRLVVQGHSDPAGSPQLNQRLRRDRTEDLLRKISDRALDRFPLEVVGADPNNTPANGLPSVTFQAEVRDQPGRVP